MNTSRFNQVALSIWVLIVLTVYSPAAQPEVDSPLPGEQAASTMIVPAGFHVTLFAGEPDVQQPIGFCIDDRARLWVAEAYNYPNHGTTPGDRIIILEDSNGDGKFDKRKVFFDKLNYVTGIEVGFGGAWVMSPPYFYFIPDRNGDDVPDAKPTVLLDGFGNHANAHNLANGFAWGLDGWLYGTHGRTNWSRIGKPGTPDDRRVQFDGGVYRYHPVKHIWEPYADGTTNPWGIDWDDFGEAFVSNCVNPHIFHVIPGAHYEPWRNRESSRYAYKRIDTIADHLHFVGKRNVAEGLGTPEEDAAGGGHAHCGTMIYLGDNWPIAYRNSFFTNNIHGRRINHDGLTRVGSGYVASHRPDVVRSRDPWFMGVTLQYGPDGGVFASDWSDTGECHSVKNTRRGTGRIFKITYGRPTPQTVNLATLSDAELVSLQLHQNDWYVRHARRLLQERFSSGLDMTMVRKSLLAMFEEQRDPTRKLRALWCLQVIGGLTDEFLQRQLVHSNEHVRAWSLRLLCESRMIPDGTLTKFVGMATHDPSSNVRLHLASSLQRLEPRQRWSIAEALLSHSEDASDANLPLMNWYAVEPLVNEDLSRFVRLARQAKVPLVRQHIARRVTEIPRIDPSLAELTQLFSSSHDSSMQLDLLRGTLEGLAGRRSVRQPPGWQLAFDRLMSSGDHAVKQNAIELALLFDDPRALDSLRTSATDKQSHEADRKRAVQALVNKRAANTAELLLRLVGDPAVQSEAVRGLAEFDHPQTASKLIETYGDFSTNVRQDALQTLASRASWATQLLDAIERNQVSRRDLTAYTARQLEGLGNAALNLRMKNLWGEVRATPSDKARQIADYKQRITADSLRRADLSAGRALFDKSCANCHRMFGTGGTIGPEITGAQRMNIDYLLENLIDPSAAVAKDFLVEIIQTDAGRVVTGLVVDESEQAITVQTVNERLVIPKSEIENRALSKVSMMPDGLLQSWSFSQVRDLVGYLASPIQVLPPQPDSTGKKSD